MQCFLRLHNSRSKKRKRMATNPPSGDGHCNGDVKNHSQVFNPTTEKLVKRDKETGAIYGC